MKKLLSLLFVSVPAMLLVSFNVPFLGIISATLFALLISIPTVGLTGLGFKRPSNGILITIAVAAGMAAIVQLSSYYLFLPGIEMLTRQPLDPGPFKGFEGNLTVFLFNLMLGWLIGGFAEEILFRGFMISHLTKLVRGRAGEIVAVLATAALFGYLHSYQGITGQILTGILGLILGMFYILNKRNLWLNVFLHGTINTISFTLIYLGWL